MIEINIRPWVVIDSKTHVTTSYKITSDAAGNVILDSNYDDATNLNIWYSELIIPQGSTYYSSAQRKLNDGTILNWTTPVPLTPAYNPDGLLVNSEILIGIPITYVDINEVTNNAISTFTVSTSPFVSNGDSHYATHYYITDYYGKILYCDLYNTVDLTSTVIDKNAINLKEMNDIKIYVTHVGATGSESEPNYTNIELYKKNYNLITSLTSVDSSTDLVLNYTKTDVNLSLNIVKIELLYNNSVIWTHEPGSFASTVTVPGVSLNPSAIYSLKTYVEEGGVLFNNISPLTTI